MKRTPIGIALGLCLLIALLPVLQMGFSYYLSAQLLAVLVLCGVLMRYPGKADLNPITCIGLFVLMSAPLAWMLGSSYLLHSALRNLREFACLLIILAVLQKTKSRALVPSVAPFRFAVGAVIVTCFAFVTLQAYFLSKGTLLFIPPEYYITNASTLPDEMTLLGGYLPRPSGFFGEPSYMGFIAASLVFVSLKLFRKGLGKITLIGMAIVTVVICKTLAGIIAVTGLLVFAWYQHWGIANKPIKRVFIAVTLISYITLIVITQVPVLGRLENINDAYSEASGYTRVVVPLALAVDVFQTRPFGVPADETLNLFGTARPFYDALTRGTTDNALLNLFINYGFSAFLILFIIYRRLDDRMLLLYLVLVTMFNGDFLSYDKVAVIGLVVLLYRGIAERKTYATATALNPPIMRLRRPQTLYNR